MNISFWFLGAYVLGSIPVGAWMAKARGVDITKAGSGNIGATNVYRTLGVAPGLLVLLLDVMKGFLPSFIARKYFEQEVGLFVGVVAILGHCTSPFLRFRGGKGIATGLGVLVGSDPLLALIVLAEFLVAVLFTRYISLGSVIAAGTLAIWAAVLGRPWPVVAVFALLGFFIVYKHKANLVRLANRTESRFSFRAKREPKDA